MVKRINGSLPKPFLKWVGGKGQLLEIIDHNLPDKIKRHNKIDRYIEPFVGGGAVFFYLIKSYNVKNIYLNDFNKELILTYNVIKNNPLELIKLLSDIQKKFISKNNEERKEYYYSIRKKFNVELERFNFNEYNEKWIERASYLIFLNKTCFNGLFRVNKKGEFNVPMGRYKTPKICDEKNIIEVSKALKNTNILNRDFQEIEEFIKKNSFVYMDPPYRPIKSTSNFNSYSTNDFNDDEQIRLSEFYKKISDLGAYVLLSNSDPKNFNPKDDFFDDLYKDYHIERVNAKRMINRDGKSRGSIKEILVRNYEISRRNVNLFDF